MLQNNECGPVSADHQLAGWLAEISPHLSYVEVLECEFEHAFDTQRIVPPSLDFGKGGDQ